jgi:carbamoyltransferase
MGSTHPDTGVLSGISFILNRFSSTQKFYTMIICGLKLTHDGAIAVIDNNRLVFSIEMEKLNNNPRYTSIEDAQTIAEVLREQGYSLSDIDHFVVDGWGGYDQEALALQPRLGIGDDTNLLSIANYGKEGQIGIAQYHERTLKHDVLEQWSFNALPIGEKEYPYSSVLHVTGHIMSAYCSSPFAKNHEDAYILVWDGGMYPRLYFFNGSTKSVENLGPIFLLIGNIYTIFSQHFGPFKTKGNFAKDSLSVAGKVMAYIALGEVRRDLFPLFEEIYNNHYDAPMGFANLFANEFKKRVDREKYSDEDILCTFHQFLGEMLVQKLEKKITRLNKGATNLCFAGGCALNIKWNSLIRNSGVFKDVYVPPFPNDSGSAIGAACAVMLAKTGNAFLNWSVYSGPMIIKDEPAEGWKGKDCSVTELAQLLYDTNEPVVFLNDRAELGPRALGNRSIIASVSSPVMKDILNLVKAREQYRPVSPICLEGHSEAMFNPGCSDPYMLFDHDVREGWHERMPAICHLDGTARLQTVNEEDNPVVAELLQAYHAISGMPMLCNTSANHNGKGFFPGVASATAWNQVNYVWCDGTLYEKVAKRSFIMPVSDMDMRKSAAITAK